jgi:hypothetical protein
MQIYVEPSCSSNKDNSVCWEMDMINKYASLITFLVLINRISNDGGREKERERERERERVRERERTITIAHSSQTLSIKKAIQRNCVPKTNRLQKLNHQPDR